MIERLTTWAGDWMPHGNCFGWAPDVAIPMVVGGILTAGAYAVIPVLLAALRRKRPDLLPSWIAWSFGGFIALCGLGHVVQVYALWVGVYRLQAYVSLATGLISWPAAFGLFRALGQAHQVVTRSQMEGVSDSPDPMAALQLLVPSMVSPASSRHFRRLLDDPVVAFEVHPVGDVPTVTTVHGDALRILGSSKEEWEGAELPQPFVDALWSEAVKGRAAIMSTTFAGVPILVMYSPLGDLATGETVGASGRTWVIPEGYNVEVSRV